MLQTKTRRSVTGLPVVLVMLLCGCAANPGGVRLGEMTDEGLQRVHMDRLQYLAIRPGANFQAYTRIRLAPVEIEFARGWQPGRTGTRVPLSDERMAALRDSLAARFRQEFGAGLASNPRLALVDATGPGSLRVTARLGEVRLAVIGNEAGPGETYSRDLGHVALDLAIHDAASGALLLRLRDERDAVRADNFAATSATSVQAAFDRIFHAWGALVGRGILEIRTQAANAEEQ